MRQKKAKEKAAIKWILAILTLSTFLVNLYPAFATFTTPNTFVNVENVNLDGEATGITPNNRLSFYVESTQRWFILYTFDAGSNDFGLKYSYSDAGDISTWNNGGTLNIGNYMTTSNAIDLASSMCAWVYDNDNNIGHLIYVRFIATNGVYYRNFTISGGTITLGSEKGLLINGFVAYGSVDICLSFDNHPIAAFGGWYNPYHSWAAICDSIDGYNGTWSYVEFQPQFYMGLTSVIPTGNASCLLLRGNSAVSNPIYYFPIEFGVTANSSGGGSAFTDNSLWRYDLQNSVDMTSFGVACGEDHALVTYCASDGDAYAFTFDYQTLTKSDEYLVDDRGDGSSGIKMAMNGGIWSNEEPFVTYMDWWGSTVNKSVYCNEYDQAGYDGFFNTTAYDYILINWTSAYSTYSGWGMNTAGMVDDLGQCLIMIHNADYVAVTWFTPTGDYIVEEPTLSPTDIIWLWLTDRVPLWMGIAGALMVILTPLLIVKAFKDGDIVGFGIALLVIGIVGFALVVGWLYG